jgi:hypothetical protein
MWEACVAGCSHSYRTRSYLVQIANKMGSQKNKINFCGRKSTTRCIYRRKSTAFKLVSVYRRSSVKLNYPLLLIALLGLGRFLTYIHKYCIPWTSLTSQSFCFMKMWHHTQKVNLSVFLIN